MRPRYWLGLDSGSTVTKAIVVDREGEIVSVGRQILPQLCPEPSRIERDMEAAWEAAAGAIRQAIVLAGLTGGGIAGVGVTGHGDGLYCLDRSGRPLGHGIMSLDSRAEGIVSAWRDQGVLDKTLPLAGQHPYPYSAPSLLAWIKRYEPERFAAIGHVLFCKDWLRFRLTGQIATDLTEASTAFTSLDTQDYSDDILRLYGLGEIARALPSILEPDARAGVVSEEAAAATGIPAGTPVAAGLHDVTAAAVGMGNLQPGQISVTAGTFSINEVISNAPRIDRHPDGPRWSCRAGVRRGTWMNMAISPASSANLEWAARQFGDTQPGALLAGMKAELDRAGMSSPVIYHPFLYGSPHARPASAAFFGLKAWHGRAEMLQAVLEGIVFNHRTHVDTLANAFGGHRLRLTGGGSGDPRMGQLFADGLGRAVEVPAQGEAAALGAALCAAVAVGAFASIEDATSACCRIAARYEPDEARSAALERRYRVYSKLVDALKPLWAEISGPADGA